jgi:cytochrome c-type biogenesis protein
MIPWLQDLAQGYETPIWAAFALGLLTAVSPCPLATNITATAYISKALKSKKAVLFSGLLYTLGRGTSYVSIGLAVLWGASKFHVARFLQAHGEFYLVPLLIVVGLIMLRVLKFDFLSRLNPNERLTDYFKNKGQLGAFMLGLIFALAFCPYSGALFFGMLMPLTISTPSGLYLPLVFALGTALPVIFFSYLIAFSATRIGKAFSSVQRIEKSMRFVAGAVFVAACVYHAAIFLL